MQAEGWQTVESNSCKENCKDVVKLAGAGVASIVKCNNVASFTATVLNLYSEVTRLHYSQPSQSTISITTF